MKCFAHSVAGKSEDDWQPLDEYLLNTSQLAGMMAALFGAGTLGTLVGLLHEHGKATPAFKSGSEVHL